MNSFRLILVCACIIVFAQDYSAQETVFPVIETDPVLTNNGADDPAIWLHPTDPDSSFFVGTNKLGQGRLELYNLDGTRFFSTVDGTTYNNVDVMYDYVLNGDTIDLVGACNKPDTSLDFFKIDPDTRTLINITGDNDVEMTDMYGFSMYNDMCNDLFYAFLTRRTANGRAYQYEMINTDEGLIDIELVRTITNLDSRTEGMVADPVLGHFYIAEETIGIWKYGARPEDGEERVLIDSVSGPNLTAAVEGLCIYYTGDSTGYLLSSSQNADDFQVYRRESDNEFLGSFEIDASVNVDGVYHADGIDVLSYPLGSMYPSGVFITHDLSNDDGYSNYKTVHWGDIADALDLEIVLDVNPREFALGLCDETDTTDTHIYNQNLTKITLFPNPVRHNLTLQGLPDRLLNTQAQVYSIMGEVVFNDRLKGNQLEVSHLPAGRFIVRIEEYFLSFVKTE
ncbi:MAG: 3-phytase [Flavobacteriales bacterium]|jgi:3-phytase